MREALSVRGRFIQRLRPCAGAAHSASHVCPSGLSESPDATACQVPSLGFSPARGAPSIDPTQGGRRDDQSGIDEQIRDGQETLPASAEDRDRQKSTEGGGHREEEEDISISAVHQPAQAWWDGRGPLGPCILAPHFPHSPNPLHDLPSVRLDLSIYFSYWCFITRPAPIIYHVNFI